MNLFLTIGIPRLSPLFAVCFFHEINIRFSPAVLTGIKIETDRQAEEINREKEIQQGILTFAPQVKKSDSTVEEEFGSHNKVNDCVNTL